MKAIPYRTHTVLPMIDCGKPSCRYFGIHFDILMNELLSYVHC